MIGVGTVSDESMFSGSVTMAKKKAASRGIWDGIDQVFGMGY
jgi:hypothetical protein